MTKNGYIIAHTHTHIRLKEIYAIVGKLLVFAIVTVFTCRMLADVTLFFCWFYSARMILDSHRYTCFDALKTWNQRVRVWREKKHHFRKKALPADRVHNNKSDFTWTLTCTRVWVWKSESELKCVDERKTYKCGLRKYKTVMYTLYTYCAEYIDRQKHCIYIFGLNAAWRWMSVCLNVYNVECTLHLYVCSI